MDVATINQTIRDLVEDADGTFADDPYLQTKLNLRYTAIQNRLGVYSSDFQEYTVELPAVPAGTPDLSAFMVQGKPLFGLITPREIEWKLPGLDSTNYFDAEGPLDKLRDIAPPGIPALDCWSFKHLGIQLGLFSTPLDLRVTGDFLAPPVNASDNQIQLALNILPVIAYEVAVVIAKARGNQQWVTNYQLDANDAWDDFLQGVIHQRLDIVDRLGKADGGLQGPRYTGLIR